MRSVLIALLLVASACGRQESPIDGKWRPNYSADCADKTYLAIDGDRMQLVKNGVPVPTVKFDITVAGTEARPLIQIKIQDGVGYAAMNLQAVVTDDTMRFESAQWSPESIKAHGLDYLEARSPARETLSSFRGIEPLHRCP